MSDDLKTCTTNAQRNRLIGVNLIQKKIDTVQNLIVLDAHPVTINGNKLSITLDKTESEMFAKVDRVAVGSFIVGTYEQGYLYRVTNVNQTSLLTREFTVKEAGLEDIIVNGTGILQKQLTHADLKDTPVSADGKYYRMSLGNPHMRLLTDGPDSATFTVGMIMPRTEVAKVCEESVLEFNIGDKLSQSNDEMVRSSDWSGKGCFAWGEEFAVVPAFSFKSDFNMAFDIRWGRFKGVKVTSESSIKTSILIKLFKELKLAKYEKQLFKPILFKPSLNFAIGVIPVNVTPKFKMEFKSSVTVSGSVEFGYEFDQTAIAGFDFRLDREEPLALISDVQRNGRWLVGDDSKVSLVAKLGVDTSLSLLIYRAIGPSVGIENQIEAEYIIASLKDYPNPCDAPHNTVKYKFEPYIRYDTLDTDNIPRVARPFIKPVFKWAKKYKDRIKVKFKPWETTLFGSPSLACDDSPAIIDVVGNRHYGQKRTDLVEKETYTITNRGGNTPLDWHVRYDEHPAISVTDKSGKRIPTEFRLPELGKNESTTVSVAIDYSKVPYGQFNKEIEFVKGEGNKLLLSVFGVQNEINKDIDVYCHSPAFPAPSNLTTQVTADNTVLLKWEKPTLTSDYQKGLVKHYRLFVKTDCQKANSEWQLFSTLPNVFGVVNQFLYIDAKPNVDYCFAIQSAGDHEQSKLDESEVINFKKSTLAGLVSPEAFVDKPTTLYLIGNKAIAEAKVTVDGTDYSTQAGENAVSLETPITFTRAGETELLFEGKFADDTIIFHKQTFIVSEAKVDSDINWLTSPLNGHQYTALDLWYMDTV